MEMLAIGALAAAAAYGIGLSARNWLEFNNIPSLAPRMRLRRSA
jgi:hypothetical protein